MTAAIVANGPTCDYGFARRLLTRCDYIVGCDGGMRHLYIMDVMPNCVMGDFDSASTDLLRYYATRSVPNYPFPAEKDETDLALCMAHVLSRNPKSVVIVGATGGRFDHLLANCHTLTAALTCGIPAAMVDAGSIIRLVSGRCALHGAPNDIVTLIPFTESARGVTTEGLYYPLRGETLALGTTRGVSNSMTGETASVTVQNGILLMIQTTKMTDMQIAALLDA